MSEWWGEMLDPGPVGDLEIHNNFRSRTRLAAILTGIPALVITRLLQYLNMEILPKLVCTQS